MWIHVRSTAFDIMSLNGQGQLCPLTCPKWRDLSTHNRMSKSRTLEKKPKNNVTLTWKFPWKSCSTSHLLFLSSNPKILNWKLFPPKWSLLNAQQKKKNEARKAKKGGGEKVDSKRQNCCVTFKPKNLLEILLSVHARTLKPNILHLDQKATKCTTCKWLYGKF